RTAPWRPAGEDSSHDLRFLSTAGEMSTEFTVGGDWRLSAAAVRAACAGSGRFWRDIDVVPRTGSTNADMLETARRGAPEGTVLVAEAQTAGRGRLGRSWVTSPGAALTFSVLLRPAVGPAADRRFGGLRRAGGRGCRGAAEMAQRRPGWRRQAGRHPRRTGWRRDRRRHRNQRDGNRGAAAVRRGHLARPAARVLHRPGAAAGRPAAPPRRLVLALVGQCG